MGSPRLFILAYTLASLCACSKRDANVNTSTVSAAPVSLNAASAPGAPTASTAAPPAPAPAPVKCTQIVWSKGDLPDARGIPLQGKLRITREKNASGAAVEFADLSLDAPLCDPNGTPVRAIQVGEVVGRTERALDGKHVTMNFEGFTTARSDEVHMRPIIGEPMAPTDATRPFGTRACATLAWPKVENPSVRVSGLTGTLAIERGDHKDERNFTLTLDAPICNPEGKAVRLVEFAPTHTPAGDQLKQAKLLAGKRVSVTGEVVESFSPRDHLFALAVVGAAQPL